MKHNPRLWHSSGLLLLALLAGFLLWKSRAKTVNTFRTGSRDVTETAISVNSEAEDPPAPMKSRKAVRKQPSEKTDTRTYGTFQREAARIFGEAEAARTTKLDERFSHGAAAYLYVVEPPTKGEIETIRAQISDLRSEVPAARKNDFEDYLNWLTDSYDPYGSDKKVIIISVPASNKEKMHAEQIACDDLQALRKDFMSGGPNAMSVKLGWMASFNGVTLDRFEHLMIWEPEKD